MTDASEPLDELVAHAHETRVIVIGGGIAGLVAALECAKVGMPVTLVEASARLGGTIAGVEIDGLPVDTGASCWSTRGGTVRRLVEELGLADRIVTPRTDRTWIAGLPSAHHRGAAAPVPEDSVLGIPANPWDESVRRIIGWGGAWRAYLDRLRPPLTIGNERNLGKLVRSRMGPTVRDRLVAPLTAGGYGLTPDDVDVAVAAPGLTSALTRTGSLGGAVAELLVGRGVGGRALGLPGTEQGAVGGKPRAAAESLEGGMLQLVAALEERLRLLGVEIVLGERAIALGRDGREWRVEVGPASSDARSADAVIVATDRAQAVALLGDDFASVDTRPGIVREVVTLVVDDTRLDALPRGAQVYPVPGTHGASRLVHQTARWEWLALSAGPGRHVLSVNFDEPAGPSRVLTSDERAVDDERVVDDDAAFARARAEASALLGVELDERSVRAGHRARFDLAAPESALGHADATLAVRARIAKRAGVAGVGAWLSGSGLAQVVADAQTEADRLRRSVLWGGADAK